MTAHPLRVLVHAATALAAVFFLVGVAASARPPDAAAARRGIAGVHAELHACMVARRSPDDCLDEIAGKALIERAQALADAGARGEVAATAFARASAR